MSGEDFVKEKAVGALFAAFKNYILSPKDALDACPRLISNA